MVDQRLMISEDADLGLAEAGGHQRVERGGDFGDAVEGSNDDACFRSRFGFATFTHVRALFASAGRPLFPVSMMTATDNSARSDEHRVGKEFVRTFSYRWSPCH